MKEAVVQDESCDREALSAIRARIDQHLKFFDILERIRWQFTSGFGVGAALGLFLALAGESSKSKIIIGHCLVTGLGIAAIVSQIRIYALVVVIWKRILKLQAAEFEIIKRCGNLEDRLRDSFLFPRVGIFKNPLLHLLTVGIMSCLVFSLGVGLSTSLVLQKFGFGIWTCAFAGILGMLLLTLFSLIGSRYYIKSVESQEDTALVV